MSGQNVPFLKWSGLPPDKLHQPKLERLVRCSPLTKEGGMKKSTFSEEQIAIALLCWKIPNVLKHLLNSSLHSEAPSDRESG